MDIKKVIKEFVSEPTGTLSWGRIASTISLVAAIAWVTKLVWITHTLPELSGIATFVVAPYASNKIATAAQAFSGNPVGKPSDKPEEK